MKKNLNDHKTTVLSRVLRWASSDWTYVAGDNTEFRGISYNHQQSSSTPSLPLCKNIYDLLDRVKPPDMYAEVVNKYVQNSTLVPNRSTHTHTHTHSYVYIYIYICLDILQFVSN